MIIPLTPINEAWNLEPTKEKPQSNVPIGFSNDDVNKYEINKEFVPRTLDVTIRDRDVIKRLLPLIDVKRTSIVTNLLSVFFGNGGSNAGMRQNDVLKPPSVAQEPATQSMYPSSAQTEEFFQASPMSNDESVQLVLMALVAYILFDKLMTIWARS